jgi:phosphatidylglycerol lysyltransferase
MRLANESEYFASRSTLPREAAILLEEFAYEFGQTYDAYLVIDPDREYFWAKGRSGVVGFKRWGGCAYVVGGLLAPLEAQSALLEEFLDFATAERLNVSFYNLAPQQLEVFRRRGLEITKVGEEPIVDLAATSWTGKPYEWLRRQENYCTRQGVHFREIQHDAADPEYRDRIVPELEEISRIHLAGTMHGRELQFFASRFDPLTLGRRRLFVAERGSRIEAFVTCNPCMAGDRWAIEMFRRRDDATRGAIPFTMMKIMRKLKTEGVTTASLSLVPGLRTGRAMTGDSRLMRFITSGWWHGCGWIYDMQGLYHFKSRFRPDYSESYVAAWPRITLLSALGFGATWGVVSFSPWKLAVRGVRLMGKSRDRAALAKPSVG